VSSWIYALSKIPRRLRRWHRARARTAARVRKDDFYDIFMFGPHG